MKLTKSQIDHLINVHGLRPARFKEDKQGDQQRYSEGYKLKGSIQKSIFEIVKQTIK